MANKAAPIPITISLEYRVAGSNAIFVKDATLQCDYKFYSDKFINRCSRHHKPESNHHLGCKSNIKLHHTPRGNILVNLDYPIGFQFLSATPAPSFGNNVWNLGDLAPGAEHDISISGKMVGVFNGDQKTFNISSGSQSSTNKSAIDVVYNSIQQTVQSKNLL